MLSTSSLKTAVEEALRFLSSQPDVREAEAFASFNRSLLARLNYTSHIPCNGVEEPKSSEMYGLGIRVVLDSPDGRIGFGSEPSDLSVEGARRAFDKARRVAVVDREFRSLPAPTGVIRINDNITRVLRHIVGITREVKGTVAWSADEVVYAPEIAVGGVHVDEIAGQFDTSL